MILLKLIAILAIVIVATFALDNRREAYAAEILCNVDPASTFFDNQDSNDGSGQTYRPSTSFTIGAVKGNWYRFGTDTNIEIAIVNTSGGKPDFNSIIASEVISTSGLPEADGVTASNNIFSCDPLIDPGQYVVFDPPAAVLAGTDYAIAWRYDSGPVGSDLILTPWTPSSDTVANADFYDCVVPGACTLLTPATWDLVNSQQIDMGFAIFDNIEVEPVRVTADTWLENFMSDFLRIHGDSDRLVFAGSMIVVLVIGLLRMGIPPLFTLGFGFLMSGVAVVGTLFDPALFLAMFAVAGVAGLISIVFGRAGGETDG